MRPSYIAGIIAAIGIAMLVNFYIYSRGLQALPRGSRFITLYTWLFWIVACSWFAGRLVEIYSVNVISKGLVWTGSFWFAFMLYFFLAAILFDILRVVNHFFSWYPPFIVSHYDGVKSLAALITVITTIALVVTGYANTLRPATRTVRVDIPKKAGPMKSLNIVLVTDLHMGVIIHRSRIRELVEKINLLKPDIVLIPGDIIDENVKPVEQENFNIELKKIRSRYGTFAVTGNHEYLGGIGKTVPYIESCGITVLDDRCVKIADGFYLAGRKDAAGRFFTRERRKPLANILEGIDTRLPLILMDHQPLDLVEPGDRGIDLQLSGHTHAGQLWPISFILNRMLYLNHGYAVFNNTQFYVSSGFGTWGPPVRLGTRPEIVNILVTFSGS